MTSSTLTAVLEKIKDQIRLEYDYVAVISGDEGTGKSRGLLLPILDIWYKRLLKLDRVPDYALATDIRQFCKNIAQGKKGDIVALDEAGDALDTQDYANYLNKVLYQSYTIIRERKLFTILVLPSFFDLNPRFRKRRVDLLFHIYRRVNNKCRVCGNLFTGEICENGHTDYIRGHIKVKIYPRERIKRILEDNKNLIIKTVSGLNIPYLYIEVAEYKGELLAPYKLLKDEKTTDAIKKLQQLAGNVPGATEQGDKGRVCTHYYRYIATYKHWRCRNCGLIVTENPFQKEPALYHHETDIKPSHNIIKPNLNPQPKPKPKPSWPVFIF